MCDAGKKYAEMNAFCYTLRATCIYFVISNVHKINTYIDIDIAIDIGTVRERCGAAATAANGFTWIHTTQKSGDFQ